jgi:hypothetical protein
MYLKKNTTSNKDLFGNPIELESDYRPLMLFAIPSLVILDRNSEIFIIAYLKLLYIIHQYHIIINKKQSNRTRKRMRAKSMNRNGPEYRSDLHS